MQVINTLTWVLMIEKKYVCMGVGGKVNPVGLSVNSLKVQMAGFF